MTATAQSGTTLPGALFATLFALVRFVAILIVELIATILVYSYLALFQLEWFGYLARLASQVLDLFIVQFQYFLPELTNTAYATLLGELGPKAMLLLLIGLVVGSVLRLVGWWIARRITG